MAVERAERGGSDRASRGRPGTYWSQSMTDPVTTPLRGESSSTTISAISSGWPSLPIGSFLAAGGGPVVVGLVEASLGLCFASACGPADVEAVDADAVPSVRVGGVAGQAGQAGLGRHVRREVPLAAVFGDREDVDDAARGAGRPCRPPPPASRRTGPRKLTAMWVSNSSGVVSSRVPRVVIPAALHRPSMRPNSAPCGVTERRACCGSAMSVCTNRTSGHRGLLVRRRTACRHPAGDR